MRDNSLSLDAHRSIIYTSVSEKLFRTIENTGIAGRGLLADAIVSLFKKCLGELHSLPTPIKDVIPTIGLITLNGNRSSDFPYSIVNRGTIEYVYRSADGEGGEREGGER